MHKGAILQLSGPGRGFHKGLGVVKRCCQRRFDWRHLCAMQTVNGVENLNKQIRRRTRVVGIFPHEASALRLISAVLAEIHDEWLTGRCYLNLESRQQEETS